MIKIDVVSGFLGAGKTTLIKKLLLEVLDGSKTVLIENEFGEIGIDGGFLQDSGVQIKEMNSGCICCSLVGDFATSLEKVIDTYHPERILIEPSGVGKLSDVLNAVRGVAKKIDVQINSAVTVVDASKAKMYVKNFGEFFINQIEHAGTIILSRADKISEEKVQETVALIRKFNTKATVITTPLVELTGQVILEAMEGRVSLKALMEEVVEREKRYQRENCHDHEHHHHEDGEECCCGHHHDHDHHHHHEHGEECCCGHHDHDHHHHADDVFSSWGMETPRKFTAESVRSILSVLDSGEYGTVLRAKGMLPSEDGRWIYFDYVPKEREMSTGSAQVIGKVCVIGTNIKTDKLEELFG